MAREAEAPDAFAELMAEIAAIRRRVDRLIWGTGMGFAATIAMLAAFRYVG